MSDQTDIDISVIVERCRAAGTLSILLKALDPSLSDDDAQKLADRLPLRLRRPHPKTRGSNEVRADLLQTYHHAKTRPGWDESAFLKAYGAHRRLPDGSFIRETRARDIIAKPPAAVRKILQQRKSD